MFLSATLTDFFFEVFFCLNEVGGGEYGMYYLG